MRFRAINFGKMLYSTLRAYFSVNTSGLYQYCACIIQPLVAPWDSFQTARVTNGLIANTLWQIGQTTNVLNYLFDQIANSIYITQASNIIVSVTGFGYTAIQQVSGFGGRAVQVRGFNDQAAQNITTINIPNYVNLSAITAIINQIIIAGIPYEIVTFNPIS